MEWRGIEDIEDSNSIWARTKRVLEVIGVVVFVVVLAAGLLLGALDGLSHDNQKDDASQAQDGSGPGGYNTLFYEPEPRGLTPAQELELLGPGLLEDP